MKSPSRRRSLFSCGSLLLGIFAILAAAIFFVGQAGFGPPVSAQAIQNAVALAWGIESFRAEYSRWPYPEGKESEAHQSDSTFMVNLIGYDTTLNKRGISFVDGIPQAKGKPPLGGLHRQGDSGMVFDSWGRLYMIYIDHDGDGQITDPEGGAEPLHQKVAVISRGPDGILRGKNAEGKDATKDNARSW